MKFRQIFQQQLKLRLKINQQIFTLFFLIGIGTLVKAVFQPVQF